MDGVKVSAVLRDLRKTHNNGNPISYKELAEALNQKYGIAISEQSLKDYERPAVNGTTENITKGKAIYGMRIETLCMLADFFDTSTDYILARSPIRTSDPDTQITVRTTGLSQEAIEKVSKMDEKQLQVLDMMIKSEHLDKMLKFISSGAEFIGFEEAIIIDKVFSGVKGQEHISALTMDLYTAIKAGFSFRSFFTGEAEKEASSMIREIATELYDKLENSNQVD